MNKRHAGIGDINDTEVKVVRQRLSGRFQSLLADMSIDIEQGWYYGFSLGLDDPGILRIDPFSFFKDLLDGVIGDDNHCIFDPADVSVPSINLAPSITRNLLVCCAQISKRACRRQKKNRSDHQKLKSSFHCYRNSYEMYVESNANTTVINCSLR